jgi:FHA domain
MHRQASVPLQSRRRKRWLAAAGGASVWAFFVYNAGSVLAGTVLLVLAGASVILLVVALRCLGIGRDHPWVRRLAARPWRDGRDVLQLALRHLPEVLIITPGGSLLAPNAVELRMNPGDLAALTEMMDIGLINSSATEVYQSQISARAASLAKAGPVEVSVIGDPDVAPGRYCLRQGRPAGLSRPPDPLPPLGPPPLGPPPLGPPPPAEHPPWMGMPPSADGVVAHEGRGQVDLGQARTVVAQTATVAALAPVPLLRLVTNGRVSQTRTSGARAGRAREAEIALPQDPTVSRVHAEFTFADGQWHITNLGLNGTTLNGTPLTGAHAIRDGDSIGWGTQPGVPVSRVEIGQDAAMSAHLQRWTSN